MESSLTAADQADFAGFTYTGDWIHEDETAI